MKPKKHPKNISHTSKKFPLNVMPKRVLKPKKILCKIRPNEEMCDAKIMNPFTSIYIAMKCFFGGASLNFPADVKLIKSSVELLCR